jgi:phosphate butyryltransferase
MNFAELKNKLLAQKITANVVVAQAEGEEIFAALKELAITKLVFPILVGNKTKITAAAKNAGLAQFTIIEAANDVEAANFAVRAVQDSKTSLLMKGNIATDVLLKAVLDKNTGLRSQNAKNILSHVAVFALPDNRFLGITDGGMNIQPDLATKVAIINNAVQLFQTLDVVKPHVAVLSAIEKVNPQIPSSADAAILSLMAKRGQIKNAVVEGPLAFDLIVSEHARQIKGIAPTYNKNADIILVPEIVCGNAVSKALVYLAHYPTGGIIVGASCPIVLLSRSDSASEKINSMLLGINACVSS